ncbi:MAG: InlB B-repeat-containing protein [Paludibacteraceae bacterium]|nr:InlB B-repeat-containing protein [Paludibacteraceae bacterium]
MKHNLLKSIFISLILLMGVGNAWAYNVPAGYYVYFEKPDNWSQASLLLGHGSYSIGYSMTKISNTKLYYWKTDKWDGYTEYFFMQDKWGDEGSSPTHRNAYAGSNKTSVFKTEFKKYHLFTTAGSKSSNSSSYATAVNRTQTIKAQIKNGSNWEDATMVLADLTASTYALTSATAAGAKSASLAKESTTVSATVDAAYSATVSLTCENVLDGYVFEGWYNANGNKITSYTVSDAHTVYARFTIKQHTVSYGVCSTTHWGSLQLNSETAITTTGTKTLNYGTSISFTAKPNAGYQVEGWYSNSGCTSKITAAGTSTTYDAGTLTADKTIYVKFEQIPATSKTITYTEEGTGWTYGASNPTSAEEGATVTFVVNPTAGYRVSVASDEATLTGPNANNQYTFTMPNKDVKINVEAKGEQYTVTLDNQGATTTGATSVTATYNAAMPSITVPAKTGYTFGGYYTATNGGGTQYYKADGSSAKTWTEASVTKLYAKWTANKYTVKFNANGGSGTMSNQSFTYDVEQALTANVFTRAGYRFIGWGTTGAGPVQYSDRQKVKNLIADNNSTYNIYAIWELAPTTIYLIPNNNWLEANARFAIYWWADGGKNGWVDMTAIDCYSDIYTAEIPAGVTDFKFVRLNPNTNANNFNDGVKWDETLNLKVQNDGKNLYTIADDAWSNGNGTWSSYSVPTTYQVTLKATTNGTVKAKYSDTEKTSDKSDVTFDVPLNTNITLKFLPNEYCSVGKAKIKIGNNEEENAQDITYTICGPTTIDVDFAKNTRKIYLKPLGDTKWGEANARFAAYAFEGGDNEWMDMTKIDDGDNDDRNDVYECDVWVKYEKIIFCRMDGSNSTNNWGNKWAQTDDQTINYPCNLFDLDQGDWPTTGKWSEYGAWHLAGSFNDWNDLCGYDFTENKENNTYVFTLNLNPGEYEFKITNSGSWYGNDGTMKRGGTSVETGGWKMDKDANCKLVADIAGDYIFTIVKVENGNPVITVTYPIKEGYQVKVTMSNNVVYTSNLVKTTSDILSFFAPGATGDLQAKSIELLNHQGKIADIPTSTFTKSDVYVAKLNSAKDGITDLAVYDGDFYIRTDMAPGGWNAYKQASNAFTHFNKYDDETYNHYWVEYTDNANVKARIANDYNSSLATELSDSIVSNANVRFSYNNETNTFARAFLGGSTNNSEFLRLVVDNEDFSKGTTFGDISNWVYEVTLKTTKGTTANVTAKHNDVNSGNTYNLREGVTLLGSGSSAGQQTIRVIYDFKKNRMICGWLPGDIDHSSGELVIDADMLVVRVNNNDASTINMTTTKDKISDLNRLYFVLELTREEVINKKTKIFWFSVPFEVQLKDVFGIEGYGTKWVVQRYRGDKRAELGFRPEIETFWANMKQSKTATLEPNRGYVLSLNLKESDFKSIDIDEDGDGNKVTKSLLRLYFPSSENGFTLSQSNSMTVEVPEHLCTVQSTEDRGPLDSHWNIIGIPSYQKVTVTQYATLPPDGGYYPPDGSIENANHAPNFLYTWNGTKDDYSVQDGTSFTYKHFYSYMVQFAGKIDWSQYTQNTPNLAAAPRRVAKKADKMYKVVLGENGANIDQTFITLSEKGNHEYTIGNDLEKIGSTSVARIYTQEGNWNLAANYLSDTTTVLPLTLSIPADGEYTLSLEQQHYSTDALLYDRATGTYTDLSKEAYTFTAEAGVNNERFALRFGMKLPGGNPTDLQQTQAQYLVRTEGKRIIIEGMAGDVRLYDMTGRVMTQLHAVDYTEITVPVTGVYVLQVGNQFEKMIIK